eukprot:8307252-Pyramimonas_sp.AAC.1
MHWLIRSPRAVYPRPKDSLTLPGLARRSDKPSAADKPSLRDREASPRGSVGGGRASSRKPQIYSRF